MQKQVNAHLHEDKNETKDQEEIYCNKMKDYLFSIIFFYRLYSKYNSYLI
jgi:hypothetical protein